MAAPLPDAALLQRGTPCCTLKGRYREVFPKDARGLPGTVRAAFRGFVAEGTLPARLAELAAALREPGDLAPLLAALRAEQLALRTGDATYRIVDASFSDDVWTLVLEPMHAPEASGRSGVR